MYGWELMFKRLVGEVNEEPKLAASQFNLKINICKSLF